METANSTLRRREPPIAVVSLSQIHNSVEFPFSKRLRLARPPCFGRRHGFLFWRIHLLSSKVKNRKAAESRNHSLGAPGY